jgi:hypothetical protein
MRLNGGANKQTGGLPKAVTRSLPALVIGCSHRAPDRRPLVFSGSLTIRNNVYHYFHIPLQSRAGKSPPLLSPPRTHTGSVRTAVMRELNPLNPWNSSAAPHTFGMRVPLLETNHLWCTVDGDAPHRRAPHPDHPPAPAPFNVTARPVRWRTAFM